MYRCALSFGMRGVPTQDAMVFARIIAFLGLGIPTNLYWPHKVYHNLGVSFLLPIGMNLQ